MIQNRITGDEQASPTFRVWVPVVSYYGFDVAAPDKETAIEVAEWLAKHSHRDHEKPGREFEWEDATGERLP